MSKPKINFILIFKVSRSQSGLKPTEILKKNLIRNSLIKQVFIVDRQITVVLQNTLVTVLVILRNYKLCNGNVRLHLATPGICQTRNSSRRPKTYKFFPRCDYQKLYGLVHRVRYLPYKSNRYTGVLSTWTIRLTPNLIFRIVYQL